MRDARCHRLVPICLTALAIVACSLPMSLTAVAQTSEEVAEAIADTERLIEEQEQVVSEAQDALASSIRSLYKSGVTDGTAAWAVAFDSDATLETLITYSQYAGALNRQQEQALDNARSALSVLTEQRDELNGLQEGLRNRLEAQLNRDDGQFHFCQWGESWSSLPYYGTGSVGSDGCGLCSYTTMVDLLTGSDYDPGEMLAMRGDWAGLEEQLDWTNGTPDGSTHREWTKKTFDIDLTTIDNTVAACREALNEPETVLIIGPMGCTMHDKYGSTRWTNGHYTCVYRCDEGGFYMHDSAYSGDAGTAVYYTDAEMQSILDTWELVTKASN